MILPYKYEYIFFYWLFSYPRVAAEQIAAEKSHQVMERNHQYHRATAILSSP